jgi:dipeptidyl aminopeptidase/acylaminoacyl peptidase
MNLNPPRIAVICALAMIGSITTAQQAKKSPVLVAKTAAAQQKVSLFQAQRFDQVAISPDGKRVAWVELRSDADGAATGKQDIFLAANGPGTKPVRLTAGASTSHHAEGGIAWSPDSRHIAFLSDAVKAGQPQLYVLGVDGGSAQKLTSVKGLLTTPKWSPDGKSVAVLSTENATRAAGPLVAETAETGEIKDAFFEQRLAIVDVATGKSHAVTPADTYIYEYDWAPDSKTILLTAAKGNGDNNWYIAELFSLDTKTQAIQSIYKPKLQIARPAVSLDGKSVAFIEGLMSDEDSVGGDVFLLPLSGGTPRNLTPGRKTSPAALNWTTTGNLVVTENIDGESGIARIEPSTGKIEELFRAPELLTVGFWSTSISLTPDGSQSTFIRSSFTDAPEIWAGPIGKWQQITKRNSGVKPSWGEAKSLHWKSDGYDVQGWLIYPAHFDPAKKYPLIVQVHGGPSAGVQPSWPDARDFATATPARGYFLLKPNPRGSFGQGEAFTAANVKDFGYGDWRDILAGVDEAIRVAPIDPNRLGLTGWSYGGYMTMWGVTQTKRFRAAVAGAGIANFASYYGENKIDQWMIPFFGKSVYDDPEVYARSSPLTFIKNVKTPTLIIVGDSDGECPTPQSYEFWHALKTQGVETQFVVYEREGHHFVNPEHIRDVQRRAIAWFDSHLQ